MTENRKTNSSLNIDALYGFSSPFEIVAEMGKVDGLYLQNGAVPPQQQPVVESKYSKVQADLFTILSVGQEVFISLIGLYTQHEKAKSFMDKATLDVLVDTVLEAEVVNKGRDFIQILISSIQPPVALQFTQSACNKALALSTTNYLIPRLKTEADLAVLSQTASPTYDTICLLLHNSIRRIHSVSRLGKPGEVVNKKYDYSCINYKVQSQPNNHIISNVVQQTRSIPPPAPGTTRTLSVMKPAVVSPNIGSCVFSGTGISGRSEPIITEFKSELCGSPMSTLTNSVISSQYNEDDVVKDVSAPHVCDGLSSVATNKPNSGVNKDQSSFNSHERTAVYGTIVNCLVEEMKENPLSMFDSSSSSSGSSSSSSHTYTIAPTVHKSATSGCEASDGIGTVVNNSNAASSIKSSEAPLFQNMDNGDYMDSDIIVVESDSDDDAEDAEVMMDTGFDTITSNNNTAVNQEYNGSKSSDSHDNNDGDVLSMSMSNHSNTTNNTEIAATLPAETDLAVFFSHFEVSDDKKPDNNNNDNKMFHKSASDKSGPAVSHVAGQKSTAKNNVSECVSKVEESTVKKSKNVFSKNDSFQHLMSALGSDVYSSGDGTIYPASDNIISDNSSVRHSYTGRSSVAEDVVMTTGNESGADLTAGTGTGATIQHLLAAAGDDANSGTSVVSSKSNTASIHPNSDKSKGSSVVALSESSGSIRVSGGVSSVFDCLDAVTEAWLLEPNNNTAVSANAPKVAEPKTAKRTADEMATREQMISFMADALPPVKKKRSTKSIPMDDYSLDISNTSVTVVAEPSTPQAHGTAKSDTTVVAEAKTSGATTKSSGGGLQLRKSTKLSGDSHTEVKQQQRQQQQVKHDKKVVTKTTRTLQTVSKKRPPADGLTDDATIASAASTTGGAATGDNNGADMGGDYLVKSIVQHRGNKNHKSGMSFRVRWVGYSSAADTWESWANLRANAQLHKYLLAHGMGSLIPPSFRPKG